MQGFLTHQSWRSLVSDSQDACSPLNAHILSNRLPETLTVAPASVIVGVVVTMTGRYRWSVWVGWVFTVVGMGILTLQDTDTPTVEWVFLNLVAGLGTGMLFPGMYVDPLYA